MKNIDVIIVYREGGTYYQTDTNKKAYIQLPYRLRTKKQVRKYLEEILDIKPNERLRICFEKKSNYEMIQIVNHKKIFCYNYG